MRMLLLTGLLAACGGEPSAPPAASAPPAPAPVEVPAAPAAAPALPAGAFACCDAAPLSELLTAYLDVHKALAADDPKAAAPAFAALGAKAGTAKGAVDPAGAALLDTIAAESQTAAAAGALADQRAAFKKLSPAVVTLTRAHPGGERKVTEAWCPMAEGGWVQEGSVISNPYEGAAMPTCGSFRP